MSISAERGNRKNTEKKKPDRLRTPRGVGTRRESPDGYVPTPGSPSLEELRRNIEDDGKFSKP